MLGLLLCLFGFHKHTHKEWDEEHKVWIITHTRNCLRCWHTRWN